MAKNKTNSTTSERSDPIDVGPDRAQALAAAFDGIYHIFGGRVEAWDTTEDGLIARGFTVDGRYDPERVLAPVASHVRRAPLMPTLAWINGMVPEGFTNPQAVTTFTVQYYKGTDGESGSKVPEWVRAAAQEYKDSRGQDFYKKRGPKTKGINFKNLNEYNAEALANADVDVSGLEHLIAIASAALEAKRTSEAEAEGAAEEAMVEA